MNLIKILRKKGMHVIVLNCLVLEDNFFFNDMVSYCNPSLVCLFDQLSLDRYTLMVIDGD